MSVVIGISLLVAPVEAGAERPIPQVVTASPIERLDTDAPESPPSSNASSPAEQEPTPVGSSAAEEDGQEVQENRDADAGQIDGVLESSAGDDVSEWVMLAFDPSSRLAAMSPVEEDGTYTFRGLAR
jgi:hypothetical protein